MGTPSNASALCRPVPPCMLSPPVPPFLLHACLCIHPSSSCTFSVESPLYLPLEPPTCLHPFVPHACRYSLYSSSCIMVVSVGKGTHGYTLDPDSGSFLLSHPSMTCPQRGQYYSLNDARQFDWVSLTEAQSARQGGLQMHASGACASAIPNPPPCQHLVSTQPTV
jgi:hypothetical protein